MELMAEALNMAPGIIFKAHLRTLGYKMDPDTAELVPLKKGGAKLVGYSREGVARVSKHDDLGAMRQAERDLADRIFGKPRQSMELAGGGSGMAMITIPQTEERAKAVANVLVSAGAVSIELGTDEL